MQDSSKHKQIELICIIVNFGLGSDIIKFSKKHGITGGTIFLGKGTVRNSILEFLELAEVRKEIVLMAAEKSKANEVLEELNQKFKFQKPNHGIAFNMPIRSILGTKSYEQEEFSESRGVDNKMYNLIMAIVDRGKAEDVIEAAEKTGSKGGTIINARGSGIHETSKLFSMEIEPEKEIVLIVSEKSLTDKIAASINEHLKMNQPGNGIIFIQDINKTYGLY